MPLFFVALTSLASIGVAGLSLLKDTVSETDEAAREVGAASVNITALIIVVIAAYLILSKKGKKVF